MAEDDNTSNTAYPNPPVYWQSFTQKNIKAYDAFQLKVKDESSIVIPADLKDLRPPSPPATGEYRIFGEHRALTAPLKGLPDETPALLPVEGAPSSPQHLLNLTRSMMLSYLELLHIMAINPEPPIYGIKWEDLRDLFKNAHHGLNMYRPWQAKESLIKLLEQTRDSARSEIKEVRQLKTKVDTILRDVAQTCEYVGAGDAEEPEKEVEMESAPLNGSRHDEAAKGTKLVSQDKDARRWAWVIEDLDRD